MFIVIVLLWILVTVWWYIWVYAPTRFQILYLLECGSFDVLEAKPFVEIYDTPPDLVGRRKPVKSRFVVKHSDFEPEVKWTKKSNTANSSYVMIGFDTEYKTPDHPLELEDIKEGKGNYRMSYRINFIVRRTQVSNGLGLRSAKMMNVCRSVSFLSLLLLVVFVTK